MEYTLKKSSIKVSASTKSEAISMFRTMSPVFQHVSEKDLVLIPTQEQLQDVYFLPRDPNRKAVFASIPVMAWDYYKGVKYALIISPSEEQIWVDQKSGIILGRNLTNAAKRSYVKSVLKDRKQQIRSASRVSPIEFWRKCKS